MPASVAEVAATVESLWPAAGAEGWDSVGLVVGDPSAEVEHIHLAVDAVLDTVDEAVTAGADLLLVHHPLLLRGVTTVAEDRYKGAVVARLIRGGCALIAAHTNADVVEDGTSGVFAHRLGLSDVTPLVEGAVASRGLGRVGTLPAEMTLGRLARAIADVLPPTAGGVRVAGDYETPVRRVALCAGAGDSLLGHSGVQASDVYITSDLRHHPASEAREAARLGSGPCLIDVSHWAAEWLWLERAAEQLRELLPSVTITASDIRTDPWDFCIVQ